MSQSVNIDGFMTIYPRPLSPFTLIIVKNTLVPNINEEKITFKRLIEKTELQNEIQIVSKSNLQMFLMLSY